MRGLRHLSVLAACVAVLAGCSNGDSADDEDDAGATPAATSAATSAEAAETSAEETDTTEAEAESELAAGLLPASEFGDGFTATALEPEELDSLDPGTALDELTVEPAECADLVDALSPYTDATDIAAQSVTSADGTLSYVQVIVGGAPALGLDLDELRGQVEACPSVSLTGEDGLSADASYVPVDASIGDDALVLRTEATVVAGDQTQTVVGSNALVLDGDRLLVLILLGDTQTDGGDAAFVDLVSRAFDFQQDALG